MWTLVLLICRIVIVKIPHISNSFGQGQNKELVTVIAVSTTLVIVYVDNCVEIVGHNCEAASRGPGSPAVAVPNPALTGSPITGLGGNFGGHLNSRRPA